MNETNGINGEKQIESTQTKKMFVTEEISSVKNDVIMPETLTTDNVETIEVILPVDDNVLGLSNLALSKDLVGEEVATISTEDVSRKELNTVATDDDIVMEEILIMSEDVSVPMEDLISEIVAVGEQEDLTMIELLPDDVTMSETVLNKMEIVELKPIVDDDVPPEVVAAEEVLSIAEIDVDVPPGVVAVEEVLSIAEKTIKEENVQQVQEKTSNENVELTTKLVNDNKIEVEIKKEINIPSTTRVVEESPPPSPSISINGLNNRDIMNMKQEIFFDDTNDEKLQENDLSQIKTEIINTEESLINKDSTQPAAVIEDTVENGATELQIKTEKPNKPNLQYQCSRCNEQFRTSRQLTSHSKFTCTESTKYTCNKCNRVFCTIRGMFDHLQTHITSDIKICQYCLVAFRDDSFLELHIKNIHGEAQLNLYLNQKLYRCTACDKMYPLLYSLQRHFAMVHQEQQKYECRICKKVFINRQILMRHMRKNHADEKCYQCEHCLELFEKKEKYLEHIKSDVHDDERFKCEHCKKMFPSSEKLAKHKLIHLAAVQSVVTPTTTTAATTTLQIKQEPIQNIVKNNEILNDKNESITKKVPKKIICGICDKPFETILELKQHCSLDHSSQLPDRPFKCDLCTKTTSLKANLRKHRLRHFEPSSPLYLADIPENKQFKIELNEKFECTLCPKIFSSSSNLSRHHLFHTKDSVTFKCDKCPYIGLTKISLAKHTGRIHGQDKKFKCDMCPKTFSSIINMSRHRIYHPEGKKLFKCDQCPRTCVSQINLTKHKLTHLLSGPDANNIATTNEITSTITSTTPTITNTSATNNAPAIINTATTTNTPTIATNTPVTTNIPTIINTLTTTNTPTIATTPNITNTSTTTNTAPIATTPTIATSPTISTAPTIVRAPTITNTSAIITTTSPSIIINEPQNDNTIQKSPEKSLESLNKQNKCKDCNESFVNATELTRHHLTMHLLKPPLQEPQKMIRITYLKSPTVLNASTSAINEVNASVMLPQLPQLPQQNDQKLPTKELNEKLPINQTTSNQSTEQNILNNKPTPQSNVTDHQCLVCFKYFTTPRNLLNHQTALHFVSTLMALRDNKSGPLIIRATPWQCKICSKFLSSKTILNHHLDKHKENKLKTNNTPTVIAEPSTVTAQIETTVEAAAAGATATVVDTPKPLSSTVSTTTTTTATATIIPKPPSKSRSKAQPKPIVITRFQCFVCLKYFTTKFNLRLHKKKTHGIFDEPTKELPQIVSNLKCEICSKRFLSEKIYLLHKQHHATQAQFEQLPTTTTILVENPIKLEIKQEEKQLIKCDKCFIEFNDNESLFEHSKELHKIDLNTDQHNNDDEHCEHICDICQEKFKTNQQLHAHKIKHTKEILFGILNKNITNTNTNSQTEHLTMTTLETSQLQSTAVSVAPQLQPMIVEPLQLLPKPQLVTQPPPQLQTSLVTIQVQPTLPQPKLQTTLVTVQMQPPLPPQPLQVSQMIPPPPPPLVPIISEPPVALINPTVPTIENPITTTTTQDETLTLPKKRKRKPKILLSPSTTTTTPKPIKRKRQRKLNKNDISTVATPAGDVITGATTATTTATTVTTTTPSTDEANTTTAPEEPIIIKPYKCSNCPLMFETLEYQSAHDYFYHSDESPLHVKSFKKKLINPWFCKFCNKTFDVQKKLENHSRVHTGERKYECETCGKTFIMQSSIQFHSIIHKENRFKCSICLKEYSQRKTLRLHMKLHEEPSLSKCPECDKIFSATISLKHHIKTVHGKKKIIKKKQSKKTKKTKTNATTTGISIDEQQLKNDNDNENETDNIDDNTQMPNTEHQQKQIDIFTLPTMETNSNVSINNENLSFIEIIPVNETTFNTSGGSNDEFLDISKNQQDLEFVNSIIQYDSEDIIYTMAQPPSQFGIECVVSDEQQQHHHHHLSPVNNEIIVKINNF